jgi:hypothetical protein
MEGGEWESTLPKISAKAIAPAFGAPSTVSARWENPSPHRQVRFNPTGIVINQPGVAGNELRRVMVEKIKTPSGFYQTDAGSDSTLSELINVFGTFTQRSRCAPKPG